uniref:heterogeneous nuclear ribonucleoprotein A1-like isoform X2 n=1 Tax=Myxine glutinosa TaxID=7769 RepID=UPI0035900B11
MAEQRKVLLDGLEPGTTSMMLRCYFNQFGKVTNSAVIIDGKSDSKGYVTMNSVEEVDEIMKAVPHTLNDHSVDVQRAVSVEDANSVTRLFVGGLHKYNAEKELRRYFVRYGPIKNVDVPFDHVTGRHRGFAFIEFENNNVVEQIVQEKSHMIGPNKVETQRAMDQQYTKIERPQRSQDELYFSRDLDRNRPREQWAEHGREPRQLERLSSMMRRDDDRGGYAYSRTPVERAYNKALNEMGRYSPHESHFRHERSSTSRGSSSYAPYRELDNLYEERDFWWVEHQEEKQKSAWRHFQLIGGNKDGEQKVRCCQCKAKLTVSGNDSTVVVNHLEIKHPGTLNGGNSYETVKNDSTYVRPPWY